MSPVCVRFCWSSALARPKSVTHTVPCVSSSKFDGLMSRCSTPCLWAYSSASATCTPILATLCQYVGFPLLDRLPSRLRPGSTTEDDGEDESDTGDEQAASAFGFSWQTASSIAGAVSSAGLSSPH